jgi:hypothetical protein
MERTNYPLTKILNEFSPQNSHMEYGEGRVGDHLRGPFWIGEN